MYSEKNLHAPWAVFFDIPFSIHQFLLRHKKGASNIHPAQIATDAIHCETPFSFLEIETLQLCF
jgi:hypothetical protein